MKNKRTWFTADKSGFNILHTLFQISIKYPAIRHLDEFFCVDLIVDEGRCKGVVAIEIATGDFVLVAAKAVIIATGGAGRVFLHNTNGGISATAWQWPIVTACRCATWNSCNTVRPACPAPGCCSRSVAGARVASSLIRTAIAICRIIGWSDRPVAAQQGHGARPARPPQPSVLA